MNAVRDIADAVLYEGYMLYPYRPTSVKNRQRWTFGGLYPPRAGSPNSFVSQFLVESVEEPRIQITARFLHLLKRDDGLEEGIPREVGVGPFMFPASERQRHLEGLVEYRHEQVSSGLYRVTVKVVNNSKLDDPLAVLASTHAIAQVTSGAFVSMTDPPERYKNAALQCNNTGVWPVLAGDPGSRRNLLISPIILYDYPQIAPESAGDLFDGTEIDEILSLRIMTLTDGEKEEIRATDSRTRRVLERTESLSRQELMKLHGALRSPRLSLKRGDRVRLWPAKKSDIMDIALAGQIAEIESIEVDFDDRVHIAVVLDIDPGRDLGTQGQPGHRFFFSPEEVEPVP